MNRDEWLRTQATRCQTLSERGGDRQIGRRIDRLRKKGRRLGKSLLTEAYEAMQTSLEVDGRYYKQLPAALDEQERAIIKEARSVLTHVLVVTREAEKRQECYRKWKNLQRIYNKLKNTEGAELQQLRHRGLVQMRTTMPELRENTLSFFEYPAEVLAKPLQRPRTEEKEMIQNIIGFLDTLCAWEEGQDKEMREGSNGRR
jgi:hypothetical protein